MELNLKRIAKTDNYTIGKLYINGKYECDTLEDTDRDLTSSMSLEEIKSKKKKFMAIQLYPEEVIKLP